MRSNHSITTLFFGKSLVSLSDLSKEEIVFLLDKASDMSQHADSSALTGKLMATCFFEPSTRTRLSFEAAMKRLGGEVIGFSESGSTSISKRETIHDTIKVIGSYADLIVIRHPLEGSARLAAEVAGVPVINAGDGANQHPTQTLLDLYTIRECQGEIEGLHIACAGDLKHSRTIHSLIQAASHFNMRMYFVAPAGLELPRQMTDELKRRGVLFSFHSHLSEVMPKLDIVYMTRVQAERFDKNAVQYSSSGYGITLPMLERAKATMRVLAPMPRLDEIDRRIDATPHAYYFQQARNGIPVRQALIKLILAEDEA